MNNQKGYPCPCCGFLTLSEAGHGSFEICPVCGWEDDDAQYNNPNLSGGANRESLNQARQNYNQFGISSKDSVDLVRSPLPDEIP